ncbi:hypothetical protein DACRYDRAFT_25392 [Dacryopinax primogenitus]|uniref:Helicase SWR1 n=1 Tax=Dacryopinax primogenitus (strain DJM 731) TaxID=1858805 RepID=M5FZM1_DACPD|nr:uncharacterized protein DACRYDRAFT_25392 [Dacryopinax primogenitus]EJT96952.1 hypothetical protein DACRYDRAFT_25392 [Dacryopinax primogenitus]
MSGRNIRQPSSQTASSAQTKRRNSSRLQPTRADAPSPDFNAFLYSHHHLSSNPIENRRQVLIRERQNNLRIVFGEHDALVREAFHLENFVTMVGYEPEDAKQDKSSVYHEFESQFNLLNAIPSNPPRSTRHRASEGAELLAALTSMSSSRSSKSNGTAAELESSELSAPTGLTNNRGTHARHATDDFANGHELRRLSSRHQPHDLALSSPLSNHALSTSSEGPTLPLVRPLKRPRPIELNSTFAKVKRIRFTVKLPPAEYTNPDQKPSRPKFARSVDDYLDSYFTVGDEEVTVSELEASASRDAILYDRITALQAKGRLRAQPERPVAAPVSFEAKRPLSHWDVVISHAAIQMKRMQDELRAKQNVTRRISRAVAAHFDRIAQTEERERLGEEKRLRALAKFIVREVIKKWREAINHVREVRSVLEKEELARQGKKQLNAILEQSTQVLEAQQMDLTRGGRSGSASTPASWTDSSSQSEEGTNYGSDVDGDTDDEDTNEEVQSDGEMAEDHSPEEPHEQLEDTDGDGQYVDDETDHSIPEHVEGPALARVHTNHLQAGDGFISPSTEMVNSDAKTIVLKSHGWRRPPRRSDEPTLANLDTFEEWKQTHFQNDGQQNIATANLANPLNGRVQAEPVSPALVLHEEDDGDFNMEVSSDIEEQDREMEHAMEEEDNKNDDSDEEIGGLQQDADIPIEALLRQYGYTVLEDDVNSDHCGDFDTAEGQMTALTAENGKMFLLEDRTVEALSSTGSSTVKQVVPEDSVASESSTTVHTVHFHEEAHPAALASMGDRTDAAEESISAKDEEMEEASEAESSIDKAVDGRIRPPFLLRGALRPYQHAGLEWLVSLYNNGLNGILADEMGLGKTIQTIALLAHLACDRGIWGPHLIIVPTSVLLNWEMEFKRFLPGFKILTYYGSIKERREKRHGWNTEFHFNVCITSYQLVLADQHIFRRKQWRYMILDEAHNIKNFRSQRWQTLLGFHSQRRLLLTGTPLQNNLMELWSLLYFLMPSGLSEEFSAGTFAGQKQFAEWFSNPMDKAISNTDGAQLDDETLETVNKLHTLLRPYILRRMKSEVEKQLPAKYEHIVECRLSKRQRLLYDEFMQRASTRETLATGSFLSVVNLLMQLRKICNHPDLFEVRPILTSFAMGKSRSAIADFEIKELLIRRRMFAEEEFQPVDLKVTGLVFTHNENISAHACHDMCLLDATSKLPFIADLPEEPPPHDIVGMEAFNKHIEWQEREATRARWQHIGYLNSRRCTQHPVYGFELLRQVRKMHYQVVPLEEAELNRRFLLKKLDRVHAAVQSYHQRVCSLAKSIDQFAFVTPAAVALDLPRIALPGVQLEEHPDLAEPAFDTLHDVSVKLQIAFPEARLLQYDCGKLQELDVLLRERKAGNHRVLIFTQMTKVLDILEIFLNLHGYRYLRLDGATKIEQRQLVTERFNADARIFAFIASSRSGGVGINLTGADTVIFYDSDFNPAMDRQCEDRAHRIGQTRDVHIYRFITKHTIEENMLLTANHKRTLDDVVIRQGDFDWRRILVDDLQMEQALAQVEDQADAEAARIALNEEKEDAADFDDRISRTNVPFEDSGALGPEEEEDVGGTTIDYMVAFVEREWEYFGLS